MRQGSDFEFIIVDDGSTDDTWSVIHRFDDPRIRGERVDRMGFTRALNHGLSLARGEYVALWSSVSFRPLSGTFDLRCLR